MKQTKFFWARYKSKKSFDLNKENLNNLNDWFIVQKFVTVAGSFYQSTEGIRYYLDANENLIDIEIANFTIERPYSDEELQYLHEQEEELKRLFQIL
jgi:hypothetical protein